MALTLLTADAPSSAAFGTAQWGIFSQDGGSLLTVDSVADVDYARDYRISDYPQEKGAFQSYNKVKIPFQAKVGFYIAESRFAFLSAVESAVASLEFVTVVTPEIQYESANLTHYGYRREVRHGVTIIRVEVWCQEIRIAGTTTEAKSQSTNAAIPEESGNVQTTPAGDSTFEDQNTESSASGAPGVSGTRVNTIKRSDGSWLLPDGTVISDAPEQPK